MSDRFSGLRRRYLSLGLGELAAAAVFAAAALMWQHRLGSSQATAALWCGLFPLLFVLIQAGIYWLLARSWMLSHRAHGTSDRAHGASHRMPHSVARILRGLRVINPMVLLAGLAGIAVNFPTSSPAAAVVLFVWAFGVAEYVNYYLVRLAYPWPRWAPEVSHLRTPRLLKDIRSAR